MKTIELIVPCYNESDVLEIFYREVSSVMQKIENYSYSFIFVNDGSSDNTADIIKRLSEKDEKVKFISFSRNFGKEAAMLSGLSYSSADLVGILDADLQHSPSLIPEMIKAIEEGFDVAAAKRTDRVGEAGLKSSLSQKFYKVADKLSEVEIDDGAQDFRIMKRKVVNAIVSLSEHNRFTKGIFSWVGFKTKWFPHENRERAAGETKWSMKKLFRYAIDGILAFSNSPLRFPFYAGFLFSASGVILFLISLALKLICDLPMGLAYMGAIFFVGGVILISLGIIGEYLARIYAEAKDRPHYIIDETNIKK
ncbi:MAG: glycosyltransferase family 2 protein [Clostridia bacterium]|nr:glycosyltransferase family 2 protein [Clostridia bacterium]